MEFKAVATTGIRDVRMGMTEAESNFELFDLQGNRVAHFTAGGMASAMDYVRSGALKVRGGVYMLRGKTVNGVTVRKVGVYAE